MGGAGQTGHRGVREVREQVSPQAGDGGWRVHVCGILTMASI